MIFDLAEKIIDEAIEREYVSGKTKQIKVEFPFYLNKHHCVVEDLKKRYASNGWKLDIRHKFIQFSFAIISPQEMPTKCRRFGHKCIS
jgi:hypothetical protein